MRGNNTDSVDSIQNNNNDETNDSNSVDSNNANNDANNANDNVNTNNANNNVNTTKDNESVENDANNTNNTNNVNNVNSVDDDVLQALRVENMKLKTAQKYELTQEQMMILGDVDDDYDKRAKSLSKIIKTMNTQTIKRDSNIGGNTNYKPVTGNDCLRNLINK